MAIFHCFTLLHALKDNNETFPPSDWFNTELLDYQTQAALLLCKSFFIPFKKTAVMGTKQKEPSSTHILRGDFTGWTRNNHIQISSQRAQINTTDTEVLWFW